MLLLSTLVFWELGWSLAIIPPSSGLSAPEYSPSSNYTYDDSDLIALDKILKNYDRRVTPQEPTLVNCAIYLRSFGSVNAETMDFELDLYLRQLWTDYRLRSPNFTRALDLNSVDLLKKVWKPDVYFPNAKTGEFQTVTVPNILFRIEPNGNVLYVIRLKLTFSCMMNMERYPLDSQNCHIELASFSKTTAELKLQWLPEGVQFYEDLKIAQFSLQQIKLTSCRDPFKIGDYSCLRAELDLKRSIGHYLVQSYLPTTLIVVVSWVSFFFDVDAIPARITLGVTTLLTITSESSDLQGNVAPVSYVKALDVWQGMCTMFVFAALLEFTVVSCISRRKPKKSKGKSTDGSRRRPDQTKPPGGGAEGEDGGGCGRGPEGGGATTPERAAKKLLRPYHCAKSVDKWSRIVFPFCFIVFNAVYWAYYLR